MLSGGLPHQQQLYTCCSKLFLFNFAVTARQQRPENPSFTFDRGSTCFLLHSTNIFINLNLICSLAEVQIDESVVVQLVSMGFDKEGCRKAVYHTNNQGMIILVKLFRW